MGKKSLKKYNKETMEWEVVSAPDISVDVKLPDGSEITDNDVMITNSGFSADTLNEALDEINDGISRLQRNVSWLDAHKGEGSGGGGGGVSSYKIKIISPNADNGNVYLNSDELRVQFMITGPSSEDSCSYAYQFDEEPLSDYIPIKTNSHVFLPKITISDGLAYHTLTIKAINPYGINIVPVSINIYKSTLKLAFNESEAGDSYSNLTYYIKYNTRIANVPFLITNGMQNAEVTLHAEYRAGSKTESLSLGKLPSGTVSRNFDFWSLIPKGTVDINSQYVIEFYATSIIGTYTAQSNRVAVRIAVVNPDELTILVGVNGTSEAGQSIPTDSIIYYNFRISAPIGVSSAYYAAKIVNETKNVSHLILGKYFDDDVRVDDAVFTDNPVTERDTTISASYYVSMADFSEDDQVKLFVKAWNFRNYQQTAETVYEMLIGAPDNSIYPRQYQSRQEGVDDSDTLLFCWNKNNAIKTGVDSTKWVSEIENYNALSVNLDNTVVAEINVADNNSSSGIIPDVVPYMRLQNRAYAFADISSYSDEIIKMTDSVGNRDGFTISITLNADNATDNNHTLFLWGQNNPDGTLLKGIRIDSDKIYWMIEEKTKKGNVSSVLLSCNFTCGAKKTVDFSFVRVSYTSVKTLPNNETVEVITSSWKAIVYVNGVMNAAADINELSNNYSFPSTIYFSTNVVSGVKNRFSDVNFYEFSVYTKALNDMQIAINGKNARLDGRPSDEAIIADYNQWKAKNFITTDELDATKPLSIFFKEGKYETSFNSQTINSIAQQSTIPTLWLTFTSDDNFTYDFFYSKHTTDVTSIKRSGRASYYDPQTNRLLNDINIWLSLQGTSTLGYRVKNVELYMRDTFRKDAVDYPYLFQPKKEWFPESQFTIKADVVDSAHANNAVLGEWINNCGILENNPVMNVFNSNTRPKDINDNGEIQEHVGSDGSMINYDEDVTIKHTLEGFPILLFIKFSDKDLYEFVGIYSFNLGRYSYYNMGMKFLKSFSARDDSGNRLACPRIIKYYEETETLGGINSNDVYSFEFGNGGNHKVMANPVWSQYDLSVIRSYGEFKYPSGIGDEHTIWRKLGELFESTAKFRIDSYNGIVFNGYDGIKYYTIDTEGNYVTNGEEIQQGSVTYDQISAKLNIENAVAYFIIVNAFGMTDSLGKNMVLRTWDGGQKWYVCFYDMDTALGISNDGAEDVPVTVSIDKVTMVSDLQTGSIMNITFHDDNSRYAAVYAKLWGILRSNAFIYDSQGAYRIYEYVWNNLRKSGGKLAYAENFTTMMEERIAACGEIMYNYDYNQKYIQGSASDSEEGEVDPAIGFLHGTRIDYVKDWLKRHFYYLDGIFPVERISEKFDFTNTDSVYNRDELTFSVNYSGSISILPYTVQVSTPSFIGISIGNDPFKEYYIGTPNIDTMIYCANSTSSNSQIIIKGSSVITKFSGLQGAFIKMMANESGVARAMTTFDISGSNILTNDPFSPGIFLYGGNSSIETLNVSRTHGGSGTLETYDIDVENFNKLLYLDCSNSDVTSIKLPTTSLKSLNISNSNITHFTLNGQNSLTEINFTGCKRLTTVNMSACNSIEEIILDDIKNLIEVNISGCTSLERIVVTNCSNIENVNVFRNQNLKSIEIAGCSASNSIFEITDCPSLTSITLNDIQSKEFVRIDTISAHNVKKVNLDRFYYFKGFKYGENEPEKYKGVNVVDLSPMEFIEEASFAYIPSLLYLRVPNFNDNDGIHNAFKVKQYMFDSANAITRIFGYIDISEGGVFRNCSDFFLNELDSEYDIEHPYNKFWEKGEVSFVETSDNPYFTNIKITSSSIDSLMEHTKCNIGDVYNIFRNCSETTLSINNMFRDCENIRTTGIETDENYGSIDPRILMYCNNIQNVDGLFRNCPNIKGLVAHEIMEKITQNVISFSYVFPSQLFFDNRYTLFAANNNITSIQGFSPQFTIPGEHWRVYSIQSKDLLANCEKAVSIFESFNSPTTVEFEENESTQLLKGLTKLKEVIKSFNFGTATNAKCIGLLCDPTDLSNYSNKLETIDSSFNFAEKNDGRDILLIGDNFFASCKNSLKTVIGSFGGNIEKWADSNDCKGLNNETLNFPYRIFSGCTKLESISGFFFNYSISGERYNEESGEESFIPTITLPSYLYNNGNRIDMFGTCIKLTDVSSCFNGMKYGTYRLISRGFKNNSLLNVSRIFSESGNTLCHKVGKIPYQLFYQEKNGAINSTIKNISFAFEGTLSTDVKCYSSDIENLNTLMDFCEENPNYGNGETKYVWNIYLNDGTKTVSQKIKSINDYTRLQQLYQIIENSGSTVGYKDLMDENEIPLYPKELSEEFYDYSGGDGEQVRDINTLNYKDIGYAVNKEEYSESVKEKYFGVDNYFCPPDLFRYCSNEIGVNINGVFKDASQGIINGTAQDGACVGYYGKLPYYMFKPIDKAISIEQLFYNFSMLLPYKWALIDNQANTRQLGVTYNPKMFDYLSNLEYTNDLLRGTVIWGRTVVKTIFNSLSNLKKAAGLWRNASWIGEGQDASAIEGVLFQPCLKLYDVTSMFEGNGPKFMYENLFQSSMGILSNCTTFMKNNGNTSEGGIPKFWDFPSIQFKAEAYKNVNQSSWGSILASHPDYT